MGKAFGLILMLAALVAGMKIYSEGLDQAYGGIFAPIASSERDGSAASHLTAAAGMADAPTGHSRPVKVTDAVRQRVTEDLAAGAARRGY
jgi:hypothetical protein